MIAVGTPMRRMLIGLLLIAAFVLSFLLLPAFVVILLGLLTLAALVLMPAGAVHGVVVRVLLVRSRRRARGLPADPTVDLAASFGFAAQRRAVVLDVLLGAVAVLATSLLAVPRSTTPTGTALLAAGGIWVCAVIAVVAIPLQAVLVTRRLQDPSLLAGEERALSTRTGAFRRIRAARVLSWIVLGVWVAGAVAAVAMVLSGPR